jgi:hypothetical protein
LQGGEMEQALAEINAEGRRLLEEQELAKALLAGTKKEQGRRLGEAKTKNSQLKSELQLILGVSN